MARASFKKGTTARRARSKVAESLKKRGMKGPGVFRLATFIAKRAGKQGKNRLARRGLKR